MSRILLLILFVVTCLVVLFGKSKISKWARWIVPIILFIIVAFRSDMMPDYASYETAYKRSVYITNRFEPFYQLLYHGLHWLSLPTISFFIVMAILTISLKWSVILRMTPFPWLSLLVWLSEFTIIQDMIAVRAALASSLLLWIIYHKCNFHYKWVWGLCIAAIMCHYSAVAFMVVPFMSVKKDYMRYYLTALVVAVVLAYVGFSITDFFGVIQVEELTKLVSLYEDQENANAFNLVQVFRCIICVLLWIEFKRNKINNRYFLMSLKLYTLGCIVFFLCWKLISVAFRFGELFWITEIIIYPYLLYCLYGHKFKCKLKYRKLIPVACAVVLFFIYYNNPFYWIGK